MLATFPIVVFGAPGALVALGLCLLGWRSERPWMLVVGGLALVPSSLYLGGHPDLGVALLLPLFPLASAVAVRRQRRGIAGWLLLPVVGAALWLAVITASNLALC